MLKPTSITTIRAYLTVLGLQHNSSTPNFEHWEGEKKSTIICVSEPEMPVLSISAMLTDVKETSESFTRIASVIR